MKPEKNEILLREPLSGEMPLVSRFRLVYRDPLATITAVNDFDSFVRICRSNGIRRVDRMKKLYNLYLAISKTRLNLSMEHLRNFKATVPDYKDVSVSFFLDDIARLAAFGIVIIDTPSLKAIKAQEEYDRIHEICRERGIELIDFSDLLKDETQSTTCTKKGKGN